MNKFMVSCVDRRGMQHSCTFDLPDDPPQSTVIRRGLEEAIQLCGKIASVGSAYVYTIEGNIIGTLR